MSLIELACRDASCAPPPTGTGGSKPGTGIKAVSDPKLGRTTITNAIREIYDPVRDYEETPELADAEERLGRVHTELADMFETYEEVGDHDIWAKLTESVETREMISKALKSDDPHPIAVAAMQQVHREIVAEMGDERWEFRRRAGQRAKGRDPFSPYHGKYATEELLRDYRSKGGTGVTSWFAKGARGWDGVVDWEAVPEDPPLPFETDNLRESVRKTIWSETIGADRVLGRIGDMKWRDEVLIAHTPETIDRLMSGTFPIVPRENQVTASALIELACRSAECAPPPTGTGGSSPIDDLADLPEGFVTDAEDAARRVFEFEMTDRSGKRFRSTITSVEENDSGVVNVAGEIRTAVSGRPGRTVGWWNREVDGWRMHHDSLAMKDEWQGRGIGSAFIAESMRRAADEGVTLVDTQAVSNDSNNGVYTWLRAGFSTYTGMIGRHPVLKQLGDRYMAAGDMVMAKRLWDGDPIATADLLASSAAKDALGASPVNQITLNLEMDISDLRTEAALAASVFTDWVERAITFTLAEDETWYEPLADEDLTAAGCQSADCAPPPVGTGGSKSVSVYHLTDDPKFAPRADFVPEDNTLAIRVRTSPGLYVAKDSWDIEKWVNGSGYLRPYVAEITVPEDAMVDERWGGEGFIPGDKLDQVTVKRLIPVDAFAREVYGDYGWVEDTLGTKFDTGEPVPTDNSVRYAEGGRPVGYVYDGPDVRDMPEAETKRLAKDAEKALGIRTGTTASADPFAGLEVYGFACHDASCAPPPIGTGGSKPGADDGVPGIADQAAYDQYRETTNNVQLLDIETAAYAQQQIQDAEVVVRISADRLSDILNYSEPEDWELRSMHDPQNEVGRSLRGEEYLQHRDLYDAAVGLDMGYVVHGYSEAEFSLEPIMDPDHPNPFEINHRVSPQAANWYGEIQLVMTDEARDDATFTISDSLNSGSVPLPIEGPIDPRAAALNGVHPFQMGRDYAEVQLRAPIEISSKHVKEIRVPDIYYLQDVIHVLAERMPDTLVTIEDDGIMMTMENAVTALEELQS